MNDTELKTLVCAAFADRALLKVGDHADAVRATVAKLDAGELRVAEKTPAGWVVNAWVKEAILLYFATQPMQVMELKPFQFHDKVPLKTNLEAAGVRVVPPGTVRYGSFLEKGVVVMPGYVNIGAWVGGGTMVDTWATVGSCAQVGRNVHLSGGVGLGLSLIHICTSGAGGSCTFGGGGGSGSAAATGPASTGSASAFVSEGGTSFGHAANNSAATARARRVMRLV